MSTDDSTADSTADEQAVDVFDNAEVRQTSEQATSPVSRATAGGAAIPSPARPAGAVPGVPDDDEVAGTAGGDPTAGVQISEEDAAAAVPGDEGPENPGTR